MLELELKRLNDLFEFYLTKVHGYGGISTEVELLDSLPLTQRTKNALVADGVMTLDQLLALSPRELLNIPNFGKKAFHEMNEVMATNGWMWDSRYHNSPARPV